MIICILGCIINRMRLQIINSLIDQTFLWLLGTGKTEDQRD